MKILVIGATGLLGQEIVIQALVITGDDFVLLQRCTLQHANLVTR